MSRIRTLSIVHHSHTDFGYTDLPSTTWDLHVDYIRQALDYARRTAHYPSDARFRWVCEVALVVEKFLEVATQAEKRQFDALVASGQWEVAAMPHNTSCLMDADEWAAMHERLQPIYTAYKPVTVFQNDINGLPWGAIPAWKNAGIRYVWMGVNTYAGGVPEPTPALWQWEGPTGSSLLTYLARFYNEAFWFFHRAEWRRGPVPHAWDVWFNAPQPGDNYGTSPTELQEAHGVLHEHLEKLPASYGLPILAVQATNQFRYDNDSPSLQLSEFVRAWNAAGLQPSLKLSTCAEFLGEVEKLAPQAIPTRRGDWCDWWAHGVTAMTPETALNQQSKRRLSELPRAAGLLGSTIDTASGLTKSWFSASMYDEHTFASYDSVAGPYRASTQGEFMQLLDFAYRADEDSRLLQADVIRKSPDYRPFSTTRFLKVLNPGVSPRSGWGEISTGALRFSANAVRETNTGEVFLLENLEEAEWSDAPEKPAAGFELPNDVWKSSACRSRFYVADLAAGETRRYELVQVEAPPAPTSPLIGKNEIWSWKWDAATGLLSSLTLGQQEIIDRAALYGLGQVIVESSETFAARAKLLRHQPSNPELLSYSTLQLLSFQTVPNPVCDRFVSHWEAPAFHRVQQQWDFHRASGLVEMTLTLWIKEESAAQAFFVAFPFSLHHAGARYYSWGHATRVGLDQLPGACGEYAMVHEGVEFSDQTTTLALATPDTPLGSFEKLHGFNGQRVFTPSNTHFYSLVHNNYWDTNFPITRAGKAVLRYRLSPNRPLAELRDELWTFPSR